MYKHYLVYKITNTTNGKYYIGAHETNNKEDGYMGSGLNIRKAIKKYSLNSFKKEILFEATHREEMFAKEKELVVCNSCDSRSYNITAGGNGSFHHINSSKIKRKCLSKNGNITRVAVNDLQKYLDVGWKLGNVKSAIRMKGVKSSREHMLNMTKNIKGSIFMFKDQTVRRVVPKDVDLYTQNGWRKGNPKISQSLRSNPPNHKGAKNPSYGKKAMCNLKQCQNKRVPICDVETYLVNGWVYGFRQWPKTIKNAQLKMSH